MDTRISDSGTRTKWTIVCDGAVDWSACLCSRIDHLDTQAHGKSLAPSLRAKPGILPSVWYSVSPGYFLSSSMTFRGGDVGNEHLLPTSVQNCLLRVLLQGLKGDVKSTIIQWGEEHQCARLCTCHMQWNGACNPLSVVPGVWKMLNKCRWLLLLLLILFITVTLFCKINK